MANISEPRNLLGLTPRTVEAQDLAHFPQMTGWFHPILLLKLLWRVILSDVFGQYADRRLMQAALDPVSKDKHLERARLPELSRDEDGAVWVDYVSDLGDGFDATYAVAYLVAQPELRIGDEVLPRGNVLVMGGDEVYPTAERDDYKLKMRLPYSFALPDVKGAEKIPLFLLPGNHDWYDGLVNFLAIFCREKPTEIGRWRTYQRRSYFAARLTDEWWVWGIDIALVRDMDQPQADYFVAIAEAMPKNANIILCSAEPGWYKAESSGDAYRTLSYAAWIAENASRKEEGKNLRIPLVLSGDSHHYARYSGAGTQYITSGGGGAFLHGTLELKDRMKAHWLRERSAELRLESCYPTKDESRKLLSGNRRFASLNPGLTWVLAGLYLAMSFVLVMAWRWDVGVSIYLALLAGLYSYVRYQEGTAPRIFWLSVVHSAAHMAVIVGMAGVVLWLNERMFAGHEWYWALWLAALAILAFTAGRWLAGRIFGWNLLLSCRYFHLGHNDAFSAMKLDSHRHFLRMQILGDTLTVYPIKLEAVPRRTQWRVNPVQGAGPADPSASVIVPDPPMNPELVEQPIVITANRASSTSEIKMPADVTPQK